MNNSKRPMRRKRVGNFAHKYSDAYVKQLGDEALQSSISAVAKKHGIKYHIAKYIVDKYKLLKRKGTFNKPATQTKGRVYLKPRVIGFKDMNTAWSVINDIFNDEQIDVIHKFYNTVLFETDSITVKDLTSAKYEQV